jgi:hypothetical protein
MKKLLLNGSMVGVLLMGLAVMQSASAKDNKAGSKGVTIVVGHHDTIPYAKNKGRQSLLQGNAVTPAQADTTRPDSTQWDHKRSGKNHMYHKNNRSRNHNRHRDTSMMMHRNRSNKPMSDSMNVRK